MSKPREMKFATMPTPEGTAFIYHMAECSEDLWGREKRDWHFVEKLPDHITISREEFREKCRGVSCASAEDFEHELFGPLASDAKGEGK